MTAATTAVNDGPSGLGGWLILPAIGLLFAPLRILGYLFGDIIPIFQDGAWEVLTTPGSEMYHALWAPLIIFETVGNLFFVGFTLVLLVLFFTKSHRFPKLMIAYLVLNLVFVVADTVLAEFIPFIAGEHDPETYKEIARGVFGVVIWVPYFLVSKRVKNTFVKPGADRAVAEVFA